MSEIWKWFTKGLAYGVAVLYMLVFPACSTPAHPPVVATDIAQSSLIVEDIPVLRDAVQISTTNYFTPKEVSEAVLIFYQTWFNTFGDPDGRVREGLNNLVLMWEPDIWQLHNVTVYQENGTKLSNHTVSVSGLTVNRVFIRVAARSLYLDETSLIHELIHVSIWNTDPSTRGDADHLGPEHPGWTQKHSALKELVNLILATKRLQK